MVLIGIKSIDMKRAFVILVLFFGAFLQAQTALYNSGNIQIHENGQLGFHTNLINDGVFDQNLGLAGFYGTTSNEVSGAFAPQFYDAEFANEFNTILATPINLINNANFVFGNVVTPRQQPDISLNFLENAFSTGEGELNKVDGYVSIFQKQNFSFPIGVASQLRALILSSESINEIAKCAYFFENPENPTTFSPGFNTQISAQNVNAVSTSEFWRLEGNVASTVQISWNVDSDMGTLVTDIDEITLVGWSKTANEWQNIGSASVMGDLTDGFLTSLTFIPDDYEVLTFGNGGDATPGEPLNGLDFDDYLVTPNGDGINDNLVFPELEESASNTVKIYDRFGIKVFEKDNYTNEFDGFATSGSFVFEKEKGLPSGVYFYVAKLHDLGLEFQGFLYLAARP